MTQTISMEGPRDLFKLIFIVWYISLECQNKNSTRTWNLDKASWSRVSRRRETIKAFLLLKALPTSKLNIKPTMTCFSSKIIVTQSSRSFLLATLNSTMNFKNLWLRIREKPILLISSSSKLEPSHKRYSLNSTSKSTTFIMQQHD